MNALWQHVDSLADSGQLRRLGGSFARFIVTLGDASPALAVACVLLSELEGRGHSCLMLDDLGADPATLMSWDAAQWQAFADAAGPLPHTARAWRTALAGAPQIWQVGELDYGQPLVLDGARLYLRRYWRDETLVADAVRTRARAPRALDVAKVRSTLDVLFASALASESPDWQKAACAIALRAPLSIITGGPGTGKTYTVARLLALLFATADDPTRQRIALAAPTGKAAARLKQAIDKALGDLADKVGGTLPLRELTARMGPARTLHSLLGARPDTRAFGHHRGNPLDVDVLIVDEASMVHLEMMAALLDALAPGAMLILLGDKDQLASVEAGAVLGDLCHDAEAGRYNAATLAYVADASGETIDARFLGDGGPLAQQTVMLRHSRRFGGPIGQLALAVNAGDAARAEALLHDGGDGALRWLVPTQQQQVVALAVDGYRSYLELVAAPTGEHTAWVSAVLQRFDTLRVLCALREGDWGVTGLNAAIETSLDAAGLIRRRREWYVGRPVMVTRNDYGTGVFNGDIGLTLDDPAQPGRLRVYFAEGDQVRSVLATRLRQVDTAYAMTVHKSQGSEFRHTVLVLPKDGGSMLARELVYTGITRASAQFTLVTPVASALADAIARRTWRASGLRDLLEK